MIGRGLNEGEQSVSQDNSEARMFRPRVRLSKKGNSDPSFLLHTHE